MSTLNEVIKNIESVDGCIPRRGGPGEAGQSHQPQGSLGRLEELARRYCFITGKDRPEIRNKIIFTFAGDHGVTGEGVSAYPKEVTSQMVLNFLRGGAGVNVLARHCRTRVIVVDMGVERDFGRAEGLEIRKVGRGTRAPWTVAWTEKAGRCPIPESRRRGRWSFGIID